MLIDLLRFLAFFSAAQNAESICDNICFENACGMGGSLSRLGG